MDLERRWFVDLGLPLDFIKRFYSQRPFGVAVTVLAWLLYAMSFVYSHEKVKRTYSTDADDELEESQTERGSSLLTLVITLVTGPYLILHFANRNSRQPVGSGHVTHAMADTARLQPQDVTEKNEMKDLEANGDNWLEEQLQAGREEEAAIICTDLGSKTVTSESSLPSDGFTNLLASAGSPTDICTSLSSAERADVSVQTIEIFVASLATVEEGVMTDTPVRESKAVNTSHQILTHTKSVGIETTGPYKKKLRRAQKLFSEAVAKAKEEKKAKVEKWRRVITKYRYKLMQLTKSSQEKGTLMAYVRKSNQVSERDVQGEAITLSDLKWKLQYQCKLNEKFSEDLRNKRAIVNSLTQIIKPEGEK